MSELKVTVPLDVEEVWSEIFGSGWEYSSWWVSIEYDGEGDWDKPSDITVKHWGKEDDTVIETTRLSVLQVLEAYAVLLVKGFMHCGDGPLQDADACTSDAVLQQAVFGEFIYG
jgi:hypothetical protein